MTLLLENISLTIGDVLLVKSFTISIEAGEIVTLMGPSGCGKSSLLAYIAGDLSPPMYGNGHVTLDGVDLVYLPAEQRHVGRLFQDDLLFPHLTVGENLLFGVPRGSLSKRQHLVSEALASAQLEGFEDRDPGTLSSGQRARVALFRALMAKPKPCCWMSRSPSLTLSSGIRCGTMSLRICANAKFPHCWSPMTAKTHRRAGGFSASATRGT